MTFARCVLFSLPEYRFENLLPATFQNTRVKSLSESPSIFYVTRSLYSLEAEFQPFLRKVMPHTKLIIHS